eukprot:TRINITY_DN28850_c0_g1_i1.p1 TRINITY_DN28850_c0_g1~~TRINITY_DN28850_c0_g1_i1.p1  ORF type:complete len:968 (+),score=119.05 TRINITY_DN28850_c0_g1_i1:70-2904(+)
MTMSCSSASATGPPPPSMSAPGGTQSTKGKSVHLLLHPLHGLLSRGGRIAPLRWSQLSQASSAEVQDDSAQTTLGYAAAQAAACIPLDEGSPRLRVRVRSQGIEVTDVPRNTHIEVPVLLSEVAYAFDECDRVVIAVVPCPVNLPKCPGANRWTKQNKHQPEQPADPLRQHLLETPHTEVGANRDIWLFTLEEGPTYSFHLLEWMGSRGAIRTDLCESYKLDKLLGKGAAANVYQSSPLRSESVHDTAAIKVLFDTGGRAEDSLVHEVSMLSKAQGSRHVCKLYSVFGGTVESTPDSVLEGAPGESSSSTARSEYYWALSCELCTCDVYAQIRQQGSLSEDATGNHVCQALSGLAYIHKKHIIHRDVKASNILITHNGSTVLADFGIAALASDTLALSCACGTPGFLGPEVLRAKTCDYKTDVFGLGASCFHMLCGRVPFTSPEGVKTILRLNASCKIPLDVLVNSNCSDDCLEVTAKLMSRKPSQRPSALDALEYPWLQQFRRAMQCTSSSSAQSLKGQTKGELDPKVAARAPSSRSDSASVAQGSIVRWIKSQKNGAGSDDAEGKLEDGGELEKHNEEHRVHDVSAQNTPAQPLPSSSSPKPEGQPSNPDVLFAGQKAEAEPSVGSRKQEVDGNISKAVYADEDPALNPASVDGAIPLPCFLECEHGKRRFKSLKNLDPSEADELLRNNDEDDDWETWRSSSLSCSSVGSSRRSARSRQSSCNSNNSSHSSGSGSDQSDLCVLPQPQLQGPDRSYSNSSDMQPVTPQTNSQRAQSFRRHRYSKQSDRQKSAEDEQPRPGSKNASTYNRAQTDRGIESSGSASDAKPPSDRCAVNDQAVDDDAKSIFGVSPGTTAAAAATPASLAPSPADSAPDDCNRAGYVRVEPPKSPAGMPPPPIPREPAPQTPAHSEDAAAPARQRPKRRFFKRVSERVSGLRNWALGR